MLADLGREGQINRRLKDTDSLTARRLRKRRRKEEKVERNFFPFRWRYSQHTAILYPQIMFFILRPEIKFLTHVKINN
jgi:hypothetical protein